jgi:hypothetical protein
METAITIVLVAVIALIAAVNPLAATIACFIWWCFAKQIKWWAKYLTTRIKIELGEDEP